MLGFSRRWVGWQLGRNLLLILFSSAFFLTLYVWKLGTLTPGLSAREAAAINASGTFESIVNNPINAPHKTLQLVFQYFGHHGAFWMRSVSVFFILLFLAGMYLTLRMWFGKFVAFAGTLIFASMPWVIIVGRSATPDIMLLSPVLLIFSYLAMARAKSRLNLLWFVFIASLTLCLYTPGLLWFILAVFIAGQKQILKTILKTKGYASILGLSLLILLLAPLVYATIQNISLAKDLLLIPDSFSGVMDFVKTFIWSLSSLVYKFPSHVDYIVGTLPMLSVALVVLAVLGFLAMWRKARAELLNLMTLFVLGILLATLNHMPILLTLCLPTSVVLSAAGLRYLYVKWFTVFPLNPLAKSFAFVLIGLLLTAQIAYGVRYGLIAWPHNMETRKAYVLH